MNGAAHVLTQAARFLSGPKEWVLFSLNLISHVMLIDCPY